MATAKNLAAAHEQRTVLGLLLRIASLGGGKLHEALNARHDYGRGAKSKKADVTAACGARVPPGHLGCPCVQGWPLYG